MYRLIIFVVMYSFEVWMSDMLLKVGGIICCNLFFKSPLIILMIWFYYTNHAWHHGIFVCSIILSIWYSPCFSLPFFHSTFLSSCLSASKCSRKTEIASKIPNFAMQHQKWKTTETCSNLSIFKIEQYNLEKEVF